MTATFILINQSVGPTTIDMANSFVQAGHEVTLVCGTIHSTTAELDPKVEIRQYAGYRKQSSFQRTVSWSVFWIRTLLYLLFRKRGFEVLAVTNPPMNVWTCGILSRLRGVQTHLLVYDIYPDAFVAYGYLRENGLVTKLWRWANRRAMRSATSIITISEPLREQLLKQSDGAPIWVIENWVDQEAVQPKVPSENPFRIQHGLQDKHVVLYSGNFGKTHDLRSILDAAEELISQNQIQFVLIGSGEQFDWVQGQAESRGLSNVRVLPYQTTDVFPNSIACGDLAIVSLAAEAERLSIPSKSYYFMATGTPIIGVTSPQSTLALLIEEHEIGIVVPPAAPSTLANSIRQLLSSPEQRSAFRANALNAASRFTPENADRVRDVVLGKSSPAVVSDSQASLRSAG